MSYHVLFSMLVVISAMGSYINYRLLKLPKTIGLTIVTLIISIFVVTMLNFLPTWFSPINRLLGAIDFKETVLNVMLGYLLFAGALHVNIIKLRKNIVSIVYLASFVVIASTITIGLLTWWISNSIGFSISLPYCLLFGALISPTDPIAVLAVFKETKTIPQNIKMKIVGEALFNDAAGILMFVFLTNMFIHHTGISIGNITYNIFHEALGGILVGWLLAFIVSFLLKKVDDKEVSILITLAISSAGYILAQKLGVSAPIAMVIAGLVIGSNMKKGIFTNKTIVALDSFWELIDEVLNAFLFVLIGLEILTINFHPIAIIVGLIIFILIFVSRYITVFIPSILSNIKHKNKEPHWRENLLMSWGGIRGGISIALALSLASSNEADTVISLTYVVVIISIVIQGGTFKWSVNKLFPPNKNRELPEGNDFIDNTTQSN